MWICSQMQSLCTHELFVLSLARKLILFSKQTLAYFLSTWPFAVICTRACQRVLAVSFCFEKKLIYKNVPFFLSFHGTCFFLGEGQGVYFSSYQKPEFEKLKTILPRFKIFKISLRQIESTFEFVFRAFWQNSLRYLFTLKNRGWLTSYTMHDHLESMYILG